MDLRDIADNLEQKAEECAVEGENSVSYWLKQLGLSDEAFDDHAEIRMFEISNPPFPLEAVPIIFQALWVDGFFHGMLAQRHRDSA